MLIELSEVLNNIESTEHKIWKVDPNLEGK